MDDTITAEDGCQLWFSQSGSGDPPLVLCHGGPGLWDYFEDVEALLGGVVRVVRWDQRGCGRSERRGPYTLARSVADLDAVCRRVSSGPVVLFGHSWGALLVLLYALEHPDRVGRLIYVGGTGIDPADTWKPAYRQNKRRRMVAIAPAGTSIAPDGSLSSPDPADEREMAVLQWTADFADTEPADAALLRSRAEQLATPWWGINHESNRGLSTEADRYLAEHDLAARCRTLDVPTLVVDGAEDIRPRGAVDSLCDALPDLRRVTLTGAGHLPWVEKPGEFQDAVAGFLR